MPADRTPGKVIKPNRAPQDDDGQESELYLVFSTGCNPQQDWQSYLLFHSARERKQEGVMTRIASGCTPQEEKKMRRQIREQEVGFGANGTGTPAANFRLHLTPDYSNVKPGSDYGYWNKPFGVKHWLENVLGFPNPAKKVERAIVVLLDPDMIIVRPFSRNGDFSDARWVQQDRREEQKPKAPRWTRAGPGRPIGQLYGFDLQWKELVNATVLLGPDQQDSPLFSLTDLEAEEGYVVGPPIVSTARDLYRIAVKWTEFAPRVHDQYPHLLGEMVRGFAWVFSP
jgi:hypothetical protein